MWLSIAFTGIGGCGPTSGTSCALAMLTPAARTKLRIALQQYARFNSFMVGILMSRKRRRFLGSVLVSEVKVKPHQQLAGIHIEAARPNHGTSPILMQPVVFVVPGESGPARHERVVTIADGVGRNVAQLRSRRRGSRAPCARR